MAIEFGHRRDHHGDGTKPSRDRGLVGERAAGNGQSRNAKAWQARSRERRLVTISIIWFYGKDNSTIRKNRYRSTISPAACSSVWRPSSAAPLENTRRVIHVVMRGQGEQTSRTCRILF